VYASGYDAPGGARGRGPGRGPRPPLTPEQQAARAEEAKKLSAWRLAFSMDRIREFRRKFEDAGVLIQVLKVDNFNSFSDDVTDYFFNVAKNLGCSALSTEGNLRDVQRLGQFAEKHRMMIGYHGHTAGPGGEAFGSPENWEKGMAVSKYNGINLDIGHFLVGNQTSPIPFLTKYHERVTHIHIKDRTYKGATVPFGKGDVPITEVLQLMKKNRWKFQATIEYEYPTPEGSDVLTEIGKCVDYCRKALV
ncbi:MAG TPA: TIM barrel protein, partial [Bryobacteraceae bacterium]|nr:TIM barrel protein [Bryobacteraceae bacterium]